MIITLLNRQRIVEWSESLFLGKKDYDHQIIITDERPDERDRDQYELIDHLRLGVASSRYPNAGFTSIDLLLASRGKRLRSGVDDRRMYVLVYRYKGSEANLDISPRYSFYDENKIQFNGW